MRQQAAEIFQPLQFGVGTPGGAEAIIHTVRALTEIHTDWAVLKLDFRNAFNEVTQGIVLD